MRRADQIAGVIVLVFSLAVIEGGRRMPPSTTFGPGAGFLPICLGVITGLLSVLLLVNASRQPRDAADRSPFPDRKAMLAIAAAAGAMAAFILLLETLGFLLATTLLSAFLLGVIERERWLTTALVAVGNAIGLYIVFQVLLGVSLPKNLLGF
jgi:putative tricarboxylic transport membrane protein